MLKLSETLVNIVKQWDPSKTKTICLTASHYVTSGAMLQTIDKYGFANEETLFRVVVREAVDKLNKDGWTRVDQAGINKHEQNMGFAWYSKYDLVISNHFDSAGGRKLTMYNPPTKAVAEQINNIRNGLTKPLGIAAASLVVGYYRGGPDMLYMVQAGKAAVLLEWFAANDGYDVNKLLVQHDYVPGGVQPPKPAPVNPTPSLEWFGHCKSGQKWGDETIIEAYNEIGGESWYEFNNAPHALSIYPGVYEAMRNINAFEPTIKNGDSVKYYGVVRTDKHNYIVYTRDNGLQGVIIIKNKSTGRSYGKVK